MKPTKQGANERRLAKLLREADEEIGCLPCPEAYDEVAAVLVRGGTLVVCAGTMPTPRLAAILRLASNAELCESARCAILRTALRRLAKGR